MALVRTLKEDENQEVRKLAKFFKKTLGFCPNSVLTMQHRPHIAKAFIKLNKAVMENKGKITSSLKRLMAYVSSNATGCRYCQAHTIRAAKRYGAKDEQLKNIWDYKTHDSFSEAERVAIDFALCASLVPNAVDDKLKEKLHKYYDEGEIVEMLGVISLFGYLNRWNDSMGTKLESEAIQSANELLSSKGWNIGKHI